MFNTAQDIYIASADRMDVVLKNMEVLRELNPKEYPVYVSVIGGLSGLNYLVYLEPEEIRFFDCNEYQIDYFRLIIELIHLAYSKDNFLSMIFDGMDKSFLSIKGQRRYRDYLLPYKNNNILKDKRNCRQLLRTFPVNERVPVGAGEELGMDERGKLVPNINTFFDGYGWLENENTFQKVKSIFKNSNCDLTVRHMDIRNDCLYYSTNRNAIWHVSNLDDWIREDWPPVLNSIRDRHYKDQTEFKIISQSKGVKNFKADPHTYAWEAIRPWIKGQVLEVTTKKDWGFREIIRREEVWHEYLKHNYGKRYWNTIILHILVGEGLTVDVFKKVLNKAAVESQRVIVLEHNGSSADFEANNYLLKSDIIQIIYESSTYLNLSEFKYIKGIKDNIRNMMAVLS